MSSNSARRSAPSPASSAPVILWFRHDLRLSDNPALAAAVAQNAPLVGLYVLDEQSPDLRGLGGAARWWLHHSLMALSEDLARYGVPLILRRGPAVDVIASTAEALGARAVVWNRLYGRGEVHRDEAVARMLAAAGRSCESHNAGLMVEPWEITTAAGGSFKVFSRFWRAAVQRGFSPPLKSGPRRQPAMSVDSDSLHSWALTPSAPDWAGGLRETWRPGEEGARARLQQFLDGRLTGYAEGRNTPGAPSTSALSPHLAFGEISPRQVYFAAAAAGETNPRLGHDVEKFQAELGWREFSYHLLAHAPELATRNWRADFDRISWREDAASLSLWTRGLTGYPIVDAGMRELWRTGWMHNRVRMITASFLIKHLLIDWRHGERWFWDTLVDADPASNAASWQWVAGSGADAAPYFRIFNPILQGEKFDPEGVYVRRYIPELARLPNAWIHRPWEAPALAASAAGIRLGRDYPLPIVDHAAARARALAAFKVLKADAAVSGARETAE